MQKLLNNLLLSVISNTITTVFCCCSVGIMSNMMLVAAIAKPSRQVYLQRAYQAKKIQAHKPPNMSQTA